MQSSDATDNGFEFQAYGLRTVRIWMSCLTITRCNFLSGKMVIMYEKFVVRLK